LIFDQKTAEGFRVTYIMRNAAWATKSKPTKPQDALKMREPHLNFLALTSRLLKPFGASERPGNVAGMLMDMAHGAKRTWRDVQLKSARELPSPAPQELDRY
jgi:hypothetical protein